MVSVWKLCSYLEMLAFLGQSMKLSICFIPRSFGYLKRDNQEVFDRYLYTG